MNEEPTLKIYTLPEAVHKRLDRDINHRTISELNNLMIKVLAIAWSVLLSILSTVGVIMFDGLTMFIGLIGLVTGLYLLSIIMAKIDKQLRTVFFNHSIRTVVKEFTEKHPGILEE